MNEEVQFAVKVLEGADVGEVFVLSSTSFIGTNANCEIALDDDAIAPMHARIAVRRGLHVVTDLTTEPDLKVNGRAVKSRPLVIGDKITLGSTVMEIITADDARATGVAMDVDEGIVVSSSDMTDVSPSKPKPKAEHVDDVPETSGEDALEYYKNKSADPSEEEGSKAKKLAGVVVTLLILAAVVVIFFVNASVQRTKVEESYASAKRYAEANPEQYARAIQLYKNVIAESAGRYPQIEAYIRSEIVEVQDAEKAREERFQKQLKALDKEAETLVLTHEYDKALEVYKVKGEFSDEITAATMAQTEKIKQQATAYEDELKKIESDARLMAAEKEEAIKRRLKSTYAEVIECMVEADTDRALTVLRSAIADEEMADNKISLGNAMATVKMMIISDDMLQSEHDSELPVVKAVLAMRKADFWQAREYLERAKDHVLYDAVIDRTQMMADNLKGDKDTIQTFAGLWKTVVGKTVTKVSNPDDSLDQIKAYIASDDNDGAFKLCEGLVKFRSDNAESEFVKLYSDVLDYADEVYAKMQDEQVTELAPVEKIEPVDGVTSIETDGTMETSEEPEVTEQKPVEVISKWSLKGDGKIGKIEARDYHIYTETAIPEGAKIVAGFFITTESYLGTDENETMARGKIHTVVPVSVIGEKEAKFTLPADWSGLKPKKEERVFLGTKIALKKQNLLNRADYSGWIDNGSLRIVGFTADMNKVAIFKAQADDSEWRKVDLGHVVYFKGAVKGTYKTTGIARVEGVSGEIVICSMLKAKEGLSRSNTPSLTP